MRITASDLQQLGVADRIIEEPLGGAHRAPDETVAAVGLAIGETLDELAAFSPQGSEGSAPHQIPRHRLTPRGTGDCG